MKNKQFDRLMELIDQVVEKIGSMHSSPMDFGTGIPLHRSEIHTIQAIGENPGINVTELAEDMRVTKGAVSQNISKLVRKGLVQKKYAEDDAKEVHLHLTDIGRIGFHNHQQFHLEMLDIVREYFGDELEANIQIFTRVMTDLNAIVDKYEISMKGS